MSNHLQFLRSRISQIVSFRTIKLKPSIKDGPVYMKKDEEFKVSKNRVTQKVEELLGVRPLAAQDIVIKHKLLKTTNTSLLFPNYKLCSKYGITNKTLIKHPEIMVADDIEQKLIELERLPFNLNITAVLLLLPLSILNTFILNEFKTSKIRLLSSLLEVKEDVACELISKRSFLMKIKPESLERNIKIILDYGVSQEDIVKDLWALQYSSKLIASRLDFAKCKNMDTLKPWMVRAPPDVIDRYIQRRSEKKSILGDSSLTEYLSARLDCDEKMAKYMITKLPALKNKSLKLINGIIDFLYSQGFQPIHIRRAPKILLHSVETTRKRLKELESEGMNIDSLHILTKSQRQYMQFYEALVKANKNKTKT